MATMFVYEQQKKLKSKKKLHNDVLYFIATKNGQKFLGEFNVRNNVFYMPIPKQIF